MLDLPGRREVFEVFVGKWTLGWLALLSLAGSPQSGARLRFRLDFGRAIRDGDISASESRDAIREETIRVLRERLRNLDLPAASVASEGSDRVAVDLAGIDPGRLEKVRAVLADPGRLEFRIVA